MIAGGTPGRPGGVQAAYFAAIAQALKAADMDKASTLVVDRARLCANAAKVQAHVRGHKLALQLVNKSLPSLHLLDEVGTAAAGARQMVFSLPYLALAAKERPHTDVLLGKPLRINIQIDVGLHRGGVEDEETHAYPAADGAGGAAAALCRLHGPRCIYAHRRCA